VDDEAESRHVPSDDEEERRARAEKVERRGNLLVLLCLVELRLHPPRAQACDPVESRVAEDRAERAGEDDELEVQRALRGKGGGGIERGLARKDREDGVEEDEEETREIGPVAGALLDERGAVPAADAVEDEGDDTDEHDAGSDDAQGPAAQKP